ncbi:MAG TPA: efflux RND transporter periplasmic adaptor subunit [Planctomycetaceae bacterium]|jgi:HlyD family secretion protein|nr:efflux RND transporter periplasmic adaptor subunit [Planctomycetaceae bacterium]
MLVNLVLLGIVAAATAYYSTHKAMAERQTTLRTSAVNRGDLSSTISATGTVEPEEVVNVGAQVSGLIVAFGEDAHSPSKVTDYCSFVEKDAVLARIDPTAYEAALEQTEASLQQAEANLVQLEAKARKAERDWKRAESLRARNAITDADVDSTRSDYESATANVAVGRATVRQAKASVKTSRTNLGYCAIKSPVRGTIIDRRVNIGQTVVASLNAPSLFLIAKDLKRMQVWASVNEADIGRIQINMPVRFTVDAHGREVFLGTVTQIRMNAQMTQNVVTYTVVVTTDNSSGKLLPYLTANVQFELDKRSSVLSVPNGALRWTPEAEQIDPTARGTSSADTLVKTKDAAGRLWILGQTGLVQPLDVRVGSTDGTTTEVSGDGLKEGMQVVVGEDSEEQLARQEVTGSEEASNPFVPKPPKGSRPPPGPM